MIDNLLSVGPEKVDIEEESSRTCGSPWEGEIEQILWIDWNQGQEGMRKRGSGGKEAGRWDSGGECAERR